MYIENTSGYYDSSGQQGTRRANFLILMQPGYNHKAPIKAIVRKVAMRQLGHFMMGIARIKGHSITLSGSYGGDGLPCSVPQDVYDQGIILPDELVQAWNTGGGWNSAGSERQAMRKWANNNLLFLTRNASKDKVINSFDEQVQYINGLGFGGKPGYPGWIVVAQARIASVIDTLWPAADKAFPYTVHYNRKAKTFIVNNNTVVDASKL